MRIARAVSNLVEAFERLPGIGPKTAQRLTYYLLHVPQAELDKFAAALSDLKKNTVECAICHNISEINPCNICTDEKRDKSLVCVVEQPLDVLAIERSGRFGGVYHVLHGAINPLHNIGPDEIRISELMRRVEEPDPPAPGLWRAGSGRVEVKELILALNPNMEGEATCLYIKRMIHTGVKITRLAAGLPTGAEIEYADDMTIIKALEGRREY